MGSKHILWAAPPARLRQKQRILPGFSLCLALSHSLYSYPLALPLWLKSYDPGLHGTQLFVCTAVLCPTSISVIRS